jgi:hypothetical protein
MPAAAKCPPYPKQMFAAGVDSFIYIESIDAPGAAGDDFAAAGQDDRGPIISFDEPGGNDADHAFMPVRLVEDGGSAIRVAGFFSRMASASSVMLLSASFRSVLSACN